MSNLQYYSYEGAGRTLSDMNHYSQNVIIGDIVKISGQGGWDTSSKIDPNDPKGQVDLAFDNVDKALRDAGLRGWEDVYAIRTYHCPMHETMDYAVQKLKERIPNHRPILTGIGVAELAFPEMKIEIEVEAYRGGL
ncbi:endoribonuclease L-PSP protein [Rhizoctonia solani]|uniref:Endoribonuclease L-PSP protein n=1 Tax=Rhizoctonia solani TaxID=456999 RepID=A0A8H8NY44_9AGAM|nr:endoribonuclease L-PSP protein [Rhizoctonia solani]QRW20453.1 endoribonuclease L-PSP protein [Rhizoctonia solani]